MNDPTETAQDLKQQCEFCGGDFVFQHADSGKMSSCPHCQQGIILGSSLQSSVSSLRDKEKLKEPTKIAKLSSIIANVANQLINVAVWGVFIWVPTMIFLLNSDFERSTMTKIFVNACIIALLLAIPFSFIRIIPKSATAEFIRTSIIVFPSLACIIGIVMGFIFLLGMGLNYYDSHKTNKHPGDIQAQANSKASPTSSSKWTEWANGYTWRGASGDDKWDLCHRLAEQSRYGVSAQTYYDALNSAYDTSDAETLNASIKFTAQYIEQSRNSDNYR